MNKKLGVKFLMGPPDCNDPRIPEYCEGFLADLSQILGYEIAMVPDTDFVREALPIFFIGSGGAEPFFLDQYQLIPEPYILLTTPYYNSLAAAMEIMGFLDKKGLKGEIIHGSMDDIARRISVLEHVARAKVSIKGMRLGCIGRPGGLIASEADAQALRQACGMELIDLSIEELISEYRAGGYIANEFTAELKTKTFDPEEIESALNVYGAMMRMIERYKLDAVTLRCFDLLKAIQTTGCLALAILNSQGIPAACEGDSQSLVSMTLLHALTGQASFMANPSAMFPSDKEIIFAHCTLPMTMPDSYTLMTHFESGIGVALSGDISPGPMTIFKCSDDLKRYYAGRAALVESLHRDDLCRTQTRLRLEDGTAYFASKPISNHHLICRGDWKDVIDEYFASL
ncbi:MAG TPA: hypothetical protein GX720_02380 [Clostridiaceae bacterium]|nr:hypothetical protein [Clostridiaceae bacterium]